jgi:hypothetical protein
MKRMLMGVGLAAVAAAVVQGCMPETLEVGRTPLDAGGASGESGSGDDTGGSAAAKGGEVGAGSGSGASSGLGGEVGVGGKGGTGAGNGGSSRGGAGGSGAGTGGEGGDPRYTFDPACDCGAYIDDDYGEFVCRLPPALFAEHFSPPENCEFDQDYVRKQECDGGMTRYAWQIYSENAYKMVFDGDTLVYGSATGYDLAEVCGFSFEEGIFGGWGTLAAGSEPASKCADACAICGQDNPEVPWCSPCTPIPGDPYRVIESLSTFCTVHSCPSTIAEARTALESSCGVGAVLIATGCGHVRVSAQQGFGATSYYYDVTTLELVGASIASDVMWGACNAFEYRGGSVPIHPCEDAVTCDSCPMPEDGAAGAGAAGAPPTGHEPCAP